MDANDRASTVRLTVDEIEPDANDTPLATLVSDGGEQLTVPLSRLPQGTRVGDVLRVDFTPDPDERARRRQHIANLQRRLFGDR